MTGFLLPVKTFLLFPLLFFKTALTD